MGFNAYQYNTIQCNTIQYTTTLRVLDTIQRHLIQHNLRGVVAQW